MRVVIVSDFGEINGGAASVAVSSARALADVGADVDFVYGVAPASTHLYHPRIALHCIGLEDVWKRGDRLAAAVQGIWNRHARVALERILAPLPREDTIVHFHQWTKAFSPSVLAAPHALGLHAVVSLHDYFLVCPNGAYYRFSRSEPCSLTPMSAGCVGSLCDRHSYAHKVVRMMRQFATARTVARAGASLSVINVSSFAQSVTDRFVSGDHARFVVRSPVRVPHLPPVAVAQNAGFVFVGRLTEEKGARLLAVTAGEAGLPLAMVGDGPLLNELSRMGGSIRCTGWIDQDSVGEILEGARALIFPSTWYETGGLAVLEALARGIPAIVSRNTAAADYVEDGVDGFVIDPKDRTALASRMLDLQDDALAARMGDEAYRRYWSDPRTVEAHAADLLAVYRTILAGPSELGGHIGEAA